MVVVVGGAVVEVGVVAGVVVTPRLPSSVAFVTGSMVIITVYLSLT